MKNYLFNILVALDQLLNALLMGSSDETLSARAWRTEQNNKFFGIVFRPIIDTIFHVFEKDHCYVSWKSELMRKQLPKSYQ